MSLFDYKYYTTTVSLGILIISILILFSFVNILEDVSKLPKNISDPSQITGAVVSNENAASGVLDKTSFLKKIKPYFLFCLLEIILIASITYILFSIYKRKKLKNLEEEFFN